MAVGREPVHRRAGAELDARQRIAGVLDGVLLRASQVLLRVAEDLDEELILRVEVPVEDALADTDAGDDLGDGRGMEAVLRELAGRDVHELAAPLPSSRCQSPGFLLAHR